MSQNLVAGIGASLWTALIGLAVVPIYVRHLGIEAYGLVGFFVALQALYQVLDLGIAPTINREVARCSALGDLPQVRDLLRTLAAIYWIVGVLIALGTLAGAGWVATEWLRPEGLPPGKATTVIRLMGFAIALRFPVGLYLAALQGSQRLAEAAAINAGMATFGAAGAVLLLAFTSGGIEAFFVWQIIVAALHVAVSVWAAAKVLKHKRPARFRLEGLQRVWRFSLGMAVVTVLGVLLSQLDKFVISRTLNLAELGRYTIAGVPARSLSLLVVPVFSVIFPRLSALVARHDIDAILVLYRNGTRLYLAIVLPLAAYVALFANDLVNVWSGNPVLALQIAPVTALLTVGTALNAIMIFPYALQLAYGDSRTPAIITIVLMLAFLPLLLWLVSIKGLVGGGVAWLALNAVYIPFGTWLTHRKLLRGEGVRWLLRDVALPLIATLAVVGSGALLITSTVDAPLLRLFTGIWLIPLTSIVVVIASPALLVQVRVMTREMSANRRPRPNTATIGE